MMYQILQKNDDISIKEDYRKNNGFDFTKKEIVEVIVGISFFMSIIKI